MTAALSLVLSFMLSTVCMYIYLIALSSSFEWFQVPPPMTTLIRKKGKQARLNSYNGERENISSRAISFLIIAISHPPLICDPGHKQEVIIHLCLPNY
jgi:hypothetical protein